MNKTLFIHIILTLSLFFTTAFLHPQTKRALLVGINNYKPQAPPHAQSRKEWWNLSGCINDVEAMNAILTSTIFDFKPENVILLKNEAATRMNILNHLQSHLLKELAPGDICFFYYSGHGSRLLNSLSTEPDHMDETLVPADWFLGVPDIRDKELKELFNQILQKKAHLTVIIDACSSGSMSRGIPLPITYRSLPPNPGQVSQLPDNTKSPAENGALILSAAQDFQAAVEIKDKNKQTHGIFTWALIKVLQDTQGHITAKDLLLKVKALIQSEGQIQEPNLEGTAQRTALSLLGTPLTTPSNPFTVPVSYVRGNLLELLGGSALGIHEGCLLKKVSPDPSPNNPQVRVTAVFNLNRCTARIMKGDIRQVKIGDLFEIDQWVIARESPMNLRFTASPYGLTQLEQMAHPIVQLHQSPLIQWVEDPTVMNPTHIITWFQSTWKLQILTNHTQQTINLGPFPQNSTLLKKILASQVEKNSKPRVFLHVPLSSELARTLQQELKQHNPSINFTASEKNFKDMAPSAVHYILVGRYVENHIQYAWVLPNSTQTSGHLPSLPIRTQWLDTLQQKTDFQKTAQQLNDSILQLVRIRAWQQLSAPPDNGRFPYHLALKNAITGNIITTGPLIEDEIYGLLLIAHPRQLLPFEKIQKRYIYVFCIDNNGKSSLLFPDPLMGNSENAFPAQTNSPLLNQIPIGAVKNFAIGPPFGVDIFILLATVEPLANPAILNFNGVRDESLNRGLTPLETCLYDLFSLSRSKHPYLLSTDWSIERLPMISQPKNSRER